MAQLTWQNVNAAPSTDGVVSAAHTTSRMLQSALDGIGSTLNDLEDRRNKRFLEKRHTGDLRTIDTLVNETYSAEEARRRLISEVSNVRARKRLTGVLGEVDPLRYTASDNGQKAAASLSSVSQASQNIEAARMRLNLEGSGNRLQRTFNDAMKVDWGGGPKDAAAYMRNYLRGGSNEKEGEIAFPGMGKITEQVKEVTKYANSLGLSPELAVSVMQQTMGGVWSILPGNSTITLEVGDAKAMLDEFAKDGAMQQYMNRYQNFQKRTQQLDEYQKALGDLSNKYAMAYDRDRQEDIQRFGSELDALNSAVNSSLNPGQNFVSRDEQVDYMNSLLSFGTPVDRYEPAPTNTVKSFEQERNEQAIADMLGAVPENFPTRSRTAPIEAKRMENLNSARKAIDDQMRKAIFGQPVQEEPQVSLQVPPLDHRPVFVQPGTVAGNAPGEVNPNVTSQPMTSPFLLRASKNAERNAVLNGKAVGVSTEFDDLVRQVQALQNMF